ncbi:MAG: hypothetical protein K2J85_06010, partial [Anaeroplasmataceae bacterium]|nr:hypothetical protein [Anaeroplasmataceae bacterium]
QYYNSSIKENVYTSFPGISRSDANTYVFNGKYLDGFQKNANESNISIACVNQDGKYYYTFNGVIAYKEDEETKKVLYSEEVVIPEISFRANGNIVLGGNRVFYQIENSDGNVKKVDLEYTPDIESHFKIDEDGYLKYDDYFVMRTLTQTDTYYKFYNKYGGNRKSDVKVCIMPTIEITNDQLTVIPRNSSRNSTDSDVNKTYRTSLSSKDRIELKIDTTTMELLVNGSKLAPTLADGTQSPNTFKVEMPTISFDTEKYVNINGIDTTISASTFGITDISTEENFPIVVAPYDASYYIVKEENASSPASGTNTGIRLSNPRICPDVTTAESGNCVIDGYYTTYRYNTSAFKTAPTLKVDGDYNLVIGGVVTDYRVPRDSISTTTGGIVKELTIYAKIFLLMLCLLSIPLMRLLQAIVPWIKRQVELVQKILSKF